ncbi:PH domain-containing protein [Neobacillus dielmonensis]|uniref:PH domain-containing protein n=1 Tax=Neobacillus dielmonensis TaxID=1347369 RepID=UPI00069420FE|nr:PH domain-containing protein [Neobacillus dielmonensis]
MRFYSKKGLITGVLLWGCICFLMGAFLLAPEELESKGEILAAILVIGITSGLICWCWFGTYYEINGNQLKVVGGPFRWKIDIRTIKEVKSSRNILSSPALSLDRLEVTYDKWGMILISPKNKQEFCKALKNVNSTIDVKL